MSTIEITSFQWGLANDKNVGQEGAFWNSSNIEFRRNAAYIELNKWVRTLFSISAGTATPRAMTFWGTGWTIATDVVLFTSNGVYTSAGQQSVTAWIINVWEANSVKYIVTSTQIYSYTNPTTNTLLDTFNATTDYRPMIDWYGDLIIGNGTNIARLNEWTTTLVDYTSGATNWTIWGLDGTIYAITSIGTNIYVWCNNGTNTNLYIWDWASPTPSQVIRYTDKPVMNVAQIANMHYWWSAKSNQSIREVLIGESYQPQLYIKSDYPNTITTTPDAERNRMAVYVDNSAYNNAIETIGDIIYLPWSWRIFWFGRYFPGQKFSFASEFSFTGTYINCMTSGWMTWGGQDAWWMLAFCARNWSNYDINLVNLGQAATWLGVIYASSGYVETMEYLASSFADWEDNKKILVPYELPSSDTSIKVYVKFDRASSYTEVKTISTTDWTGYRVAEVALPWKWRTVQFKFELITADTTETPKLYTWITNISDICGIKK
jgi:hypothetical protein